ncbi:MAG TPA: ComF family protein, partial [Nitrospirales bacterium]|nr:ComF family protein [Nitrospirales bacterium]
MAAASVLRRLVHVVLPVDCGTCALPLSDDPIPFFCRGCWEDIAPMAGPACPRCGRPFASRIALAYSETHRCSDCRRRVPAYSRAWSGYVYDGTIRDALRLFKYEKKVALAHPLGRLLAKAASVQPFETDVIVPVPLYSARLRERGFNQSLLLADRLARATGIPVSALSLTRIRATPSQTDLTRRARLQNLRRAFSVRRPAEIAGRRVLLIDDVFTTGTTVNECAKALRKAGAADVQVV